MRQDVAVQHVERGGGAQFLGRGEHQRAQDRREELRVQRLARAQPPDARIPQEHVSRGPSVVLQVRLFRGVVPQEIDGEGQGADPVLDGEVREVRRGVQQRAERRGQSRQVSEHGRLHLLPFRGVERGRGVRREGGDPELVREGVDVAVVPPEALASSLHRAAVRRPPAGGQPAGVRGGVQERDVEAVLEELPSRAEPGPPASDDAGFWIRSRRRGSRRALPLGGADPGFGGSGGSGSPRRSDGRSP
mmetsp:Transcript_12830/g.50143  ORF Transcript_12830/g.50143 Transcript_12830/m.50143 type:complete len:247 (-) Transcript_12830:73-813(-)